MGITFSVYELLNGGSEGVTDAPEVSYNDDAAFRVMEPLLAVIGKEMDYYGGVSDLVDLTTMRGMCQQMGYRTLMAPDGQRYRMLGDIIDYCTENGYEFGWG